MGEITVIVYHPGGDQEHAIEPIDANEYIVSINVAEGSNYEGVTNLTLGTFEITPAAAAVNTEPVARELTYSGNGQTLVTAGTAKGGKLVYSLSKDGAYTENIPIGTNAGDYTVWYNVQGDADYTDSAKQSVTVTIDKAKLIVTANDHTITYGEAPAHNGMAGKGFVGIENFADLTGEMTFAYDYQQYGKVGTYAITPGGLTSENYDIIYAPGTLTVEPKTIKVKAGDKSKTYGDADPELTYMVVGLVNEDSVSGALVRTEGENVGEYAITQGTLTAGENYTITFGGALLTINKRAVTIAAKDQTITYGGTISGTEITSAGLADGHSVTVTLTPSTDKVTANGTITASAAVITAGGSDVTANYEISYGAPAKLVIRPDTAAIDDPSTENVTSADAESIKEVQEMIENADSTDKAWDEITEKCEELIEKIEAVEAEKKALTDGAAEFDAETVKSSDKEKLDALTAAAVAYDIIKGDGGKWRKGSESGLSFTANGSFSKFLGIEVDGKEVAQKHYTAKSGSTIITLKESYLKNLSDGKHTITVIYTDGETDGTFKIEPKSTSPDTGDEMDLVLWSGAMAMSLAALMLLLAERKRRTR